MKTISHLMEGKKTYTGLLIIFLGALGVGEFVTGEEVWQIYDLFLQLSGFILAIYGRSVAKVNHN